MMGKDKNHEVTGNFTGLEQNQGVKEKHDGKRQKS
jgi:hypothetical protein